jgi:hypothetical protein
MEHQQAVKRIIRYVAETLNNGLYEEPEKATRGGLNGSQSKFLAKT